MTDTPASRQRLQWEADMRARALAGVFAELSGLPPSAAAEELNGRGVKAQRPDQAHLLSRALALGRPSAFAIVRSCR
jgi:hypothetical protein